MTSDSLLDSELPSDWTWQQIGDRFRITKKPRELKIASLETLPFVPMDSVPANGREEVRFQIRAPADIASGTYFERGDVLLSKITPSFENGKQGLAHNIPTTFGIASTEIIPLQPIDDQSDSRFLFYYLLHPDVRAVLTSKMEGSTGRQRVPEHAVREFPLPVPPKDQQEGIVAILSKVQRAVEIEEKLMATTRELKQATMHQLFGRGLRSGGVRETAYGELPDSWLTAPLSECAIVQSGVTKGRIIPSEEAIDVPYLRVANVQDGHLDLREVKTIRIRRRELPNYLLHDGDVVLTEGGDFDKLGRGFIWRGQIDNCVHQNHIFAVRTKPTLLLPDFLAYLAQSPYGRSYFLTVAHKTTNLACINSTKLKALPVPLPTLDEQHEIAGIMQRIDATMEAHQRKREVLRTLFSTLLSELMAGRIRASGLAKTNQSHPIPMPLSAGHGRP